MNFTKQLLKWYDTHHRDLPWRQTRDPYKIWVSEIILQQTRIGQGLDYYNRFVTRFKTVKDLASADEREVLKLWQGLGYYSRARSMHQSAKEIVKTYNGKFPSEYDEILKLKGIGDYTAAAIASIAFDQPYSVVDGNVLRFFSRYFGVTDAVDKASGKRTILDLARQMIDSGNPGKFNQAVMEFGALQCKPGVPDCNVCPFRKTCFACSHDKIEQLPVKSVSVSAKDRYFNYLVFYHKDQKSNITLYLNKREENDIWKNLYDFPLIETGKPVSLRMLTEDPAFQEMMAAKKHMVGKRSGSYRHVLSHQVIHARFIEIELKKKFIRKFIPVGVDALHEFPLPRLIEKYAGAFVEKIYHNRINRAH
jgi:A/G-specific adenine glycosylase